jgi:hypothetical protein
LEAAYIQNNSTNDSVLKVCIYNDDGDSTPDSGDTLVACSASIATGSTVGEKTGDIADCSAVVNTTNYWLCQLVDDSAAAVWNIEHTVTGTGFYVDTGLTGAYDSPPANLSPGADTWTSLNRIYEVYVTIK